MNITITARRITVRDTLREKIETKLSKFDRYFGTDTTAKVVLSSEKDRHTMEITLVYKDLIFRVQQTDESMLAALDACMDILERKIRKHKTKLQKRLKDDRFAQAFFPEEEKEYDVVKRKSFTVRPITVDEAILQMEMLGHSFFLFGDAESGELSVVYKRGDGKYGQLIPER